ncbi:MAG: hypothetical protein A2V99_18825 [Spirochaetes bacterium RBG_16_67_19]|nr:MAG: hypothetical protein A2064_04100 [Spirochaetes bacterium GWB1_66_5]OHD75959.1 MAG: hypothetical protein A2V99_18825 [Spirochaetes bacterium RBG_16_67_19]
MSDPLLAELKASILKNLGTLERQVESLQAALDRDLALLGRTQNAALIVAGLLENYYTCLETAFLRISQFFENTLDPERWHTDLLEKMTLHIEGVRLPAVSQTNYPNLLELLKFRHFRRYYFELEYDWDRLDFLVKKMKQAHPGVKQDLERFLSFLDQL